MRLVLHRTLLAAMLVAGFGRVAPRWDHVAGVPAVCVACDGDVVPGGLAGLGIEVPGTAADAPALPAARWSPLASAAAPLPVAPPVAGSLLAVAPKTSPPMT